MSTAIWRRSWWDLIVIGTLSRSRIAVNLESRRHSTSTSSRPSALDSCRSVKLLSFLYLTVHLTVWQNEKTKNHSSTRWHCSHFALSLMKNVVHWMTTRTRSRLWSKLDSGYWIRADDDQFHSCEWTRYLPYYVNWSVTDIDDHVSILSDCDWSLNKISWCRKISDTMWLWSSKLLSRRYV